MSKTNLIALAIAAALASPAAYAVDVTPATPDVLPLEAMTGNAQVITNGDTIDIAASADDIYLGRNTGYNVRVTLSGGATFASIVPAATGLNGETVTIAGGGQIGSGRNHFDPHSVSWHPDAVRRYRDRDFGS